MIVGSSLAGALSSSAACVSAPATKTQATAHSTLSQEHHGPPDLARRKMQRALRPMFVKSVPNLDTVDTAGWDGLGTHAEDDLTGCAQGTVERTCVSTAAGRNGRLWRRQKAHP